MRGFSIDDLVITDASMGRKAAGVKGMYLPVNLRDESEGSDLDDICVIAFNEFEGQFLMGLMTSTSIPLSQVSLPTNS